MTSWQPNPEQLEAIDARGRVFVSAGAGTGKTAVLVERFARAVCDEGVDVDSILVITYTKRAAGELRARIRAELRERGRPDLARELDSAWISTIHGFCNRLLKTYPFEAGLDPRFRELDESPAVAERLEELRRAARCLADDASATDLQRASASALLEALAGEPGPDDLLDLKAHRASGERAATYEEARLAAERAAIDELAMRDRDLVQQLLDAFAASYASAKRRESALDFEDLQLVARDLLRDHPEIRDREALRFRAIMVDEFQDTNRLQCDLVDLLSDAPGERHLFFVGDEFQSIYGFRHADVQVFRERRAAEGGGRALVRNYRSRPEVLAAVNYLFRGDFGDDFQPLAASGEFPDPVFGQPVELLVTDKSSYADSGTHWRRAEARHIARRVRELIASGAATAGEIVLLFAAGTDAEWYEQELRRQGIPTYRATGRGYFGQQQVVDLLAYLQLLQNRYDDRSLVSVLASPFVGVSNDALFLLRRAASRRPLFSGLGRELPAGLDERDARLLRAFKQRYERLVVL